MHELKAELIKMKLLRPYYIKLLNVVIESASIRIIGAFNGIKCQY